MVVTADLGFSAAGVAFGAKGKADTLGTKVGFAEGKERKQCSVYGRLYLLRS